MNKWAGVRQGVRVEESSGQREQQGPRPVGETTWKAEWSGGWR